MIFIIFARNRVKIEILANWWNMSYGFIFNKKNQMKGLKNQIFC